jgi:peptidoglycan/LPS O-acetylase OafA/YrhL
MTPPTRPRYVLIDALRGVAACAVMLYHFTGGDLRPGLTRAFGALALDLCHHGWLGVQVFFVLSGFVIANTIGDRSITAADAVRFGLRRQVRLDPPYWLSLALTILAPWIVRLLGHGGRPLPPARVVGAHLLYLQEILRVPTLQPVYWTLAIEVQFYLVFVAALALLRRVPKTAIPWVVLGSALPSLDAAMHWRLLHGWFAPHWYLFVLGASTYWVTKRRIPLAPHLALAAWVAWQGWQYDRLEPLGGVATVLLLTFAGRVGGLETWARARWLQFVGRVSYGVYLLHPLAASQARWHVGIHVNVRGAPGAVTVLAAAIALTLLMAWALHRAVEAPAMRLAAKIRWWHGDREAAEVGTPPYRAVMVRPAD